MHTIAVQDTQNCDKMDVPEGFVLVSLEARKREHDTLLKRIHELREELGYRPLPTGKQIRKAEQA